MTWRFEGGRELEAALSQLSTRLSRKIVTEVLHEAAEPLRMDARRMAPHAPGEPDLRDHIETMTGRAGERSYGTFTGPLVAVGPTKGFFYGFFQEFGTRHHGAQPFMRPAFDANVPKALDILSRGLWRELAARGMGVRSQTVDAPIEGGPGSGLL